METEAPIARRSAPDLDTRQDGIHSVLLASVQEAALPDSGVRMHLPNVTPGIARQ